MKAPLPTRALPRGGPVVPRLGLGLAALGRPAYHNLGHALDVPGDATPDALRAHAWEVLDLAWAAGVRWLDVARSYGQGEAFLRGWLAARGVGPREAVVASKWGYTYVGGWQRHAAVHEVKDHGLTTLRRQAAETLAELGPWLDVYSIHSATLDSGVLEDEAVLDALDALRAEHGVRVGLTVTGPRQADTLRRALDVRGGGFFDAVQATFNVLEPSVGPALAEAHAAGLWVVVKEALANGRLSPRAPQGPVRDVLDAQGGRAACTPDALALAWVLDHTFVDVVLSGAGSAPQLASHLRAFDVHLDASARAALADLAEAPAAYWSARSALAWT